MSVSEYSSSDSHVSGESPEFNSSDSPTHIPPHYVDPKTIGKSKIREKLIKSRIFDRNIPFLFHSFDTITASSTISTVVNDSPGGSTNDYTNNSLLTERMEQRLIRWRPAINSTSIEDSLNGRHPFQTLKDTESNKNPTEQEEAKKPKILDNSKNLKLLHSNSTLNLIQRLQDLKNNNDGDYYKGTDTCNDNDKDNDHELRYENNSLLKNNSPSIYNVYNDDSNNYENSNLTDDVHIALPLNLAKFYSSNLSRPTSSSSGSTLSMDCCFCCPLII